MKIVKTKVGDHFIQITCHSAQLERFFDKNFSVYNKKEMFTYDLVIEINDCYGIPFQNYKVAVINENSKIIYRRADYQIEVDKDFSTAVISVYDDLALKHALTNLYSSFIVNRNWGLLIHSSCAIENGKAHIFAGPSGAGKSTAAKLSYPRNLLSDEASLIKISEDEIQVYNSPFRSELEAEPFGRNTELASLQLLRQALQNKRLRLEKSDALLQLIDKVFFWPYCQEETKKIILLLTLLVKQVPVYELHFQKNNTFWELIS